MMSPNAEQTLDFNMSRLQNFEHHNVKLMQKEDDHKLSFKRRPPKTADEMGLNFARHSQQTRVTTRGRTVGPESNSVYQS